MSGLRTIILLLIFFAVACGTVLAKVEITANFLVLDIDDDINKVFENIGFGDAGQISFTLDEDSSADLSSYPTQGIARFSDAVTSVSFRVNSISGSSDRRLFDSQYATVDGGIQFQHDEVFFNVGDNIDTNRDNLTLEAADCIYSQGLPNTFSGYSIVDTALTLGPSTVENYESQIVYLRLDNGLESALIRGIVTITEVVYESTVSIGEFDGLTYAINNFSEVAITGINGSKLVVTVPSLIEGLPVTKISNGAFQYDRTLRNINLPTSVTTIGDRAFRGCSNLREINLSSIKFIGEYAFSNCDSIRSVTIPEGLLYIERETFSGCTSLDYVSLPTSLKYIGDYAFSSTNISEIQIPEGVQTIGNDAFASCLSLGEIELPDDLEFIGQRAFRFCRSLRSLEIPDSVRSIEKLSFASCSALQTVRLPNSLIEIQDGAFEYCAGLSSVEFPESLELIDNRAFYANRALKSLFFEGPPPTLGSNVFASAENGGGVVIVFGFSSSQQETSLDDMNPLAIVKTEYINLFGGEGSDWNGLNVIDLGGVDPPGEQIPLSALEFEVEDSIAKLVGCSTSANGLLVIPSTHNGFPVRTIGDSAFANCSALDAVTIPSSIVEIGRAAFSGCSGLISITIPQSVSNINDDTFDGCYSLKAVNFLGQVTSVGARAFRNCRALSSIDLSDYVTSIGNLAFNNCSSLENVELPLSVDSIGIYAFAECTNLINLSIPADAPIETISEGTFDRCYNLRTFIIPNAVSSIGNEAFQGCRSLEFIAIPANTTLVGDRSFSGCYDLANVDIPRDSSLKSIGQSAFSGSYAMTFFDIPESVESIGFAAFAGNSDLRSITIPEQVSFLGDFIFAFCYSLERVYFRDSAPSTGSSIFYDIPAGGMAIVEPANAASFGGIGTLWNGFLVTAPILSLNQKYERDGLRGSDAEINADPFNRGISNGIAHAFGIELVGGLDTSDLDRLPSISISPESIAQLSAEFPANAHENTTYYVELSTDLSAAEEWTTVARRVGSGSWELFGDTVSEVSESPAANELITTGFYFESISDHNCFWRVRIAVSD